MTKLIKIILGVVCSTIVVSGVSVGIYFGATTNKDEPIKTSSKIDGELKILKDGLSGFVNEELRDFITFLNYKYQAMILFQNKEKEKNITSILEFYKNKINLIVYKEQEIIDTFKLVYLQRKEFLQKPLDSLVSDKLKDKFTSIQLIKSFAKSVNVNGIDNITNIDTIINEIMDKWNQDLYKKTREIPLSNSFKEDLDLLEYTKKLNSQISTLNDIENLSPTSLYNFHYDSLVKYFENLISSYIIDNDLTTLLNSFSELKVTLLIQWINNEKNTSFSISNKVDNINNIIYYYTDKTLDIINEDMKKFNLFFTIRSNYKNLQLLGIQENLKTKFSTTEYLKQFAYLNLIGFLESDSLNKIISNINVAWNEMYKNSLDVFPVWENFSNNEDLFNIAIKNNNNLNNLNDIKQLNYHDLYQIHYDAWNDYYKQRITTYSFPDYATLPYDVENSIKYKIIEKYGSSINDFDKYNNFMKYLGDSTNKIYNEVNGVELKNDYLSLSLNEMYNFIFNFIFKNYEQYTKQAYDNLVNGLGFYKVFDRTNPSFNIYNLIDYVNKTLDELKELEKNDPQEFYRLYRKAWIDKINDDIDNFPFPINKVVSANSLMQKDNPQVRNNRQFFCDYSVSKVPNNDLITKDNWENPSLNDINEVDDIIVCSLLELPPASTPKVSSLNNDFPLIIFNNINNDLVNKGIDSTKYFSNIDQKKVVNLDRERRAREVAKIISEKLLETLSFSGEIANLDAIIFNQYDSSKKDGVEYTQIYKDVSVKPFSSGKTINLFIQNKDKDGNLIANSFRPAFNIKKLENLSFDLYETFEALARGYGHHVTLQNGLFDSQKLLDELTNVFNNGSNLAFTDFIEMYKYFNSMNSDNSLNFKDTLTKDVSEIEASEISLNTGATNALKLFRKYYSYNVRSVYDLIYGNVFSNSFTSTEIITQILFSLNTWKTKGIENPTLIQYLEELKAGDETNKENLKTYYLSYYDPNSIFNTPPKNGQNQEIKYYVKYGYVSNSYDLDNNRNSQLQVKDIFPNMRVVNWKTHNGISNLSCLNSGYNFHGKILNYDEEILLTNKFTTETEFQQQSIKTDKELLKNLQYYFSYEQLLARMYSVLTHKNFDNRKYIDQCSFDSVGGNYVKTELYLKNKNFEDYGFFRSFGMNLLSNDNEKDLYKMLTQKNDFNNNEGYIYKNKIRKSSTTIPNPNNEDEVPYSLSLRVVDPMGNDPQGWANIHLIVDLELDNPEDAFLVKFSYKKNEEDSDVHVIAPINYDYYNAFVFANDVDENMESLNNRQITSLFSSASEAKKHVTLVFKLWEILGTISDDPNSLLYNAGLIYGETINYDTIKNLFSWLDKSFKPMLFIDKRNNNKLDNNDIEIPFT